MASLKELKERIESVISTRQVTLSLIHIFFGILITMYDRRTVLSEQVAKEVRRYFKDRVFDTIIDRNVKLSEAPSYGKPIFSYDINSRGAKNYLHLALEVLNKDGKEVA